MLHNLHRQAQASHANTQSQHQPHPAGTDESVRAAVTPEQWAKLQKENDTLDKMVHKLAYQVEELKESHKDTKARADKYKQQLKEHVGTQEAFMAQHEKIKAQVKALTADRNKLQSKVEEHRVAAKRSTDSLAECRTKLDTATAELKQLKSEIPQVRKLLVQGGEAQRKLQTMQGGDSKRVQELQQQLQAARERLRSSSSASETELRAKNQQLQSEVSALKERLKAASLQASTGISQVQACKDMLSRSESVLRTCSELHASKGDALASALQHTTNNLEIFLKSLNQKQ